VLLEDRERQLGQGLEAQIIDAFGEQPVDPGRRVAVEPLSARDGDGGHDLTRAPADGGRPTGAPARAAPPPGAAGLRGTAPRPAGRRWVVLRRWSDSPRLGRPAISAISASSARTHDIITVLKFAIRSLSPSAAGEAATTVWPSDSSSAAASVAAATQTGSVTARSPGAFVLMPMRSFPGSAPGSLAYGRAGAGALTG